MIDSFTVEQQAERSSGAITSTLVDENGAPVAKAGVTSLTLTLYDVGTQQIINNRRAQNVLDANNVTMGAADGLITWAVQPLDMVVVSGLNVEQHVALFVVKWAAGAKEKAWQITIPVVNLPLYP